MLLDYFRDADLQFPGLHDKDLHDMLPTPIGEKQLNSKQSFKVNSNLNFKIAVLSNAGSCKIEDLPSGDE